MKFTINIYFSVARLQFTLSLKIIRALNVNSLLQSHGLGGKNATQPLAAFLTIFPSLQVTQLKIVSNPFAKGFRDNDTNDE